MQREKDRKMIEMPDFLNYPEWVEEDELHANTISHIEKRYKIKEDAPD